MLQYPASDGAIYDYREVINQAHDCLDIVTELQKWTGYL
ncbi:MAG: hypothetical protein ACKO4R_11945 [Synechococcales cyanobacterium]